MDRPYGPFSYSDVLMDVFKQLVENGRHDEVLKIFSFLEGNHLSHFEDFFPKYFQTPTLSNVHRSPQSGEKSSSELASLEDV